MIKKKDCTKIFRNICNFCYYKLSIIKKIMNGNHKSEKERLYKIFRSNFCYYKSNREIFETLNYESEKGKLYRNF